MTITLELGPEEARLLSDRAQAQGVDIAAVLHGLIAQMVPAPLRRQAGGPEDPEELAEREREAAEMQANRDRWRAEQGLPPAHR